MSGLQWLSEEFSLCTPLKNIIDVAGFKNWLQETWVNLAMVDYPYEANFLQPLPRWPIQVKAVSTKITVQIVAVVVFNDSKQFENEV